MTGKTIRFFLADGDPTGILLAEISDWTGKVVVAPRFQLGGNHRGAGHASRCGLGE